MNSNIFISIPDFLVYEDFLSRNLFGFHKNIITLNTCFCHLHIIAHLAFQTYVCYEAHTCFCIYTRQIACIWVTIGITILYIKDVNEIDSVFKF